MEEDEEEEVEGNQAELKALQLVQPMPMVTQDREDSVSVFI